MVTDDGNEDDDYSEVMNDPAFLQVGYHRQLLCLRFLLGIHDFLCLFLVYFIVLSFQSVLENLPGVDPQSDAIKDAVSSLSGESKKKKEDKDKDK